MTRQQQQCVAAAEPRAHHAVLERRDAAERAIGPRQPEAMLAAVTVADVRDHEPAVVAREQRDLRDLRKVLAGGVAVGRLRRAQTVEVDLLEEG